MKLTFTSSSKELQTLLNKKLNKQDLNKIFVNFQKLEEKEKKYFDKILRFNKNKLNPLLFNKHSK
jgi:hypothetical protein